MRRNDRIDETTASDLTSGYHLDRSITNKEEENQNVKKELGRHVRLVESKNNARKSNNKAAADVVGDENAIPIARGLLVCLRDSRQRAASIGASIARLDITTHISSTR